MADVLIIDDDTVAANALAKLLRGEGHNAQCAITASQALRCIKERPDLVLLDLNMPRFNGLDVLDAFQSDMQYANIPVALFTGEDNSAARDMARLLGARDYILKGQGWEETHKRIENCLGLQQRPA